MLGLFVLIHQLPGLLKNPSIKWELLKTRGERSIPLTYDYDYKVTKGLGLMPHAINFAIYILLCRRKYEDKKRFFKSTIIFCFAFIFVISAPQYVECQSLYPDEALDLFAIPNDSGDSLTIVEYHLSVFPFLSISLTDFVQCDESGSLYLERFPSELVLSVSLHR